MRPMKNMKRWKRLLAVGLCSAMMFSMTVGVSATENQDTEETTVEDEVIFKGDAGISSNLNDELPQVDMEALEESEKKDNEVKLTVEETETQENSEDLPEVEWNGSFDISHQDYDWGTMYSVKLKNENGWNAVKDEYLSDGIKEGSRYTLYINGIITEKGKFSSGEASIGIEKGNMVEPLEVTLEIDRLEHYSNGTLDGVAKNVRASFTTEKVEEDGIPQLLTLRADFDGVDNVAFKVKNTAKIGSIFGNSVSTYINGDRARAIDLDELISYDAEAEEIIVNGGRLWANFKNTGNYGDIKIEGLILVSDNDLRSKVTLNIRYTSRINWENGEKPKLIDSYCEFDGTKDMEFRFENVTGANRITSVDGIMFFIKETNTSDALAWIRIRNDVTGSGYGADVENGYVRLPKSDMAGLIYDEKWDAVLNIYGRVGVLVTLANGKQCMLNGGDGEADWSFKVLEKSPDATEQYWQDVPKNKVFTAEEMQTLVDKNKTADVTLRTPEGVYYTFAKGTMRMIEGKESFKFDLELITLFKDSDINNTKVTEADFACRINFAYSGELPGTAKISIPVDEKWNGKTLYYYQVMENGTLKDTGEKNVVKSGRYEVTQSHCSDYVLLAKSPKELGVTENTGNNNNNTGNGNNQTGNGNTQGSGNNSTTQVKPADTTKTSPKTGDNNMILLFAVLCAGSCVVGVSTLKARRKIR